MSPRSSNYRESVSLFLLLLVATVALGQSTPHGVNLPALVQRMEKAALENRANYRPYVITREYRLYGAEESNPKSEVRAQISFTPPRHQDYKIVETDGNSHGESIVRHLLKDQTKAAETGKAPGAVTTANYDFRYVGEDHIDGRAYYVLQLLPKRQETSLIDGRVWVDESTYLVRRIDGEMAKMPSWWLKSVHVTLEFDNFGGMWLQDNTKAVADVRIFGKHIFTSQAVAMQVGNTEALNGERSLADQTAARRRFSHSDAILGSMTAH